MTIVKVYITREAISMAAEYAAETGKSINLCRIPAGATIVSNEGTPTGGVVIVYTLPGPDTTFHVGVLSDVGTSRD